MKLNTVDNINKVRGASLFPRGQFVCNELQVVRLWGDRRGYRVRASGKILMQPDRGSESSRAAVHSNWYHKEHDRSMA